MMNQFLVECKTIAESANRNRSWHTWTLVPFTELRPFRRAAQQVIEGHSGERVEIQGVYRVPQTGDYYAGRTPGYNEMRLITGTWVRPIS